jgi:protein-tyrosine phosphatase
VRKPRKIAIGIAAAALACATLAVASAGLVRAMALWTAVACAVAAAAYATNRPEWLGKRDGAMSGRAVLVLPYLVAFRIACRVMRWWRGADRPTQVAPGVWVSGRVAAGALPPTVTVVVDLVAEYPADPIVRALAGYRSLPVLDGGVPADQAAFLALVREVAVASGDVLVHCDSGRGRAPTFAAALLVERGVAADVDRALALVAARRPVCRPTRVDHEFLARVAPALGRAHASGSDQSTPPTVRAVP